MIKLENVVLASPEQMEFIIEGMRNPMNSWDRSDSYIDAPNKNCNGQSGDSFHVLGENDHDLMQRWGRRSNSPSIFFDLCDECVGRLWNFLNYPIETDKAVDHYNQSKEDDKRSDDTSTLDTAKMSGESSSSLQIVDANKTCLFMWVVRPKTKVDELALQRVLDIYPIIDEWT